MRFQPASSAPTSADRLRTSVRWWLVLLLLVLPAIACIPKPATPGAPTIVQSPHERARAHALTVGELVLAADDAEWTLAQRGGLTPEQHTAAGRALRTLLQASRGYARAVAAWTDGEITSAVVAARNGILTALDEVDALLGEVAPVVRGITTSIRVVLGVPQ